MKRLLAVLVLTGILTSYFYGISLACEMKLTPDKFNVKVGEKVAFTLERIQVHRNCVLPLEETKIEIKGGKVVDPGKWTKKDGIDILKFTVQFTTPGEASVTIIRDCPKEGLQTVTVKGTVSK
ncbi:MAG: hypothetical protein ACP5RW_02650 [bacterium]